MDEKYLFYEILHMYFCFISLEVHVVIYKFTFTHVGMDSLRKYKQVYSHAGGSETAEANANIISLAGI